MQKIKIFLIIFLIGQIFLGPALARAVDETEIVPDKTEIVKARVVSAIENGEQTMRGLNFKTPSQILTVEILEGEKKGETVTFENDYVPLEVGDVFYLYHAKEAFGDREFFSVQDPYRLPVIYFFVALFVVLVLVIGGIQGLRGLLSLVGSFLLIIYVLLPGIMHGYSPILVSIGVASLIIVVGSYVTHGFNKTTSTAVLGMIATVILTGVMAYTSVHLSQFSGYGSEEAVYLNLNARGSIDIVGLLIGGIMIGLLGILYDVAIGQAISVEELHQIAPHIEKKTIFRRAMRIGREHIGALVNTLAIAYVGASLPLLLLFSTPPVNVGLTLNREIFATEIIRTLIGSIGLVLAVPITTLLAVIMLVKVKKVENSAVLDLEKRALEHFEHHH